MRRLILMIIALVPFSSSAQEAMKLEDYRRLVVDYSNQLKMAGERTVSAEAKSKAAKTGFLPSLSATGNINYQIGNKITFGEISMQDYNYNANLALQQVVWGGGAVSAQWESAKIEQAISKLSEQQALENVIYGADMTYWAFAASAQQRDVTEQYVDIVRNLLDIVKIRFNDGYVSKTDLLMVETRLNEAEIQKLAAQKLYLTSIQNLNTMLGQHTPKQYAVGDSVTYAGDLLKIETLDNALTNRPEYKIADLNIALQSNNIKLTRSKFNPQFVIGIQGVYGTPSLNFTGVPKLYGVAFGQLNVPIFHWGERRHNVNMVRSAVRSMEYSKLDMADQIASQLGTAQVALEQSMAQVEISTKNLAIAAENLSLNTYSYSEGRLPILDVLQSQLSWIQSYTAYVSSNYQYRIAQSDYQKALGGMKID